MPADGAALPSSAQETPATAQALSAARATARRRRGFATAIAVLWAVFAIVLVVRLITSGGAALVAGGGTVLALGTLTAVTSAGQVRRSWRKAEVMAGVAAAYPWQEFAATGGTVQDAAAVPQPALVLTADDGSTVAELARPARRTAVRAAVDGTAASGGTVRLWFAGDPRFGGLVALPGGGDPELVEPVNPQPVGADFAADSRARDAGLVGPALAAAFTAPEPGAAQDTNGPGDQGGRVVERPLPSRGEQLRAARGRALAVGVGAGLTTLVGLLIVLLGVAALADGSWAAIALVLLGLIVTLFAGLWLYGVVDGYRGVVRVLDVYPWREWDCKVQRLAQLDRLVLLGAAGNAVCGVLPSGGSGAALRDARLRDLDTVLFAGDVRHGGVVALADGTRVTPVRCQPLGSGRSRRTGDDAAARRAGLL
ncbi:hypothetical protein [Yinghuangia seranimata]|uniref:hypothetical protein n=1 Tax=Yinghuangia seranimata TaxID=408067 RepID=UPI00248AE329|nr:hypothetical protein [Yinghuangia seranimata]MDI2132477.1 hypothetical protein [Yinghuangia seranimata]